MKSQNIGKNTSEVEIIGISKDGLWLLARDREYFLPYEKFPWFCDSRVSDIYDVELIHGNHLYWPKIDVDLDIDTFSNIDSYPLIYR